MSQQSLPNNTEASRSNSSSSLPLGANSKGFQFSEAQEAKAKLILKACGGKDLRSLVKLATSKYGLVQDDVRKIAWPILLGIDNKDATVGGGNEGLDWRFLPRHHDEDQVRLDVARSFIYYPSHQTAKELELRKTELSDVITQVLREQPFLNYFQGYHDICQVVLLVLGPQNSVPAVARLSVLRIRDFMLPSLAPALAHLRLLPSILNAESPELCAHLSKTQPFFALAATLTLYAHDIQEYSDIARLFDVLLAREAVFSVYLFANIVILQKDALFEIPPDEPEMLHSVLCKLPQPLDIEKLIQEAVELYYRHPPSSLGPWKQISTYSVLKTASNIEEVSSQTLDDGKSLYNKQATQLRRIELRRNIATIIWKYRRHVGAAGLAAFVVVISWYTGRHRSIWWVFGKNGLMASTFKRLKI